MRRLRIAILVLLALGVLWFLFGGPREPHVADGSTLLIDVDGAYVEAARAPLIARLLGETGRPFVDLRSELKKAARDGRIDAVVLRIRSPQIGWAQAQELRELIAELRTAGRRTVAYLETSSFVTNLPYYVASAADEVHAAPASVVGVIGLAGEYLFLGGAAQALGVGFEVARVGRYKTFADTIAGDHMSDAYREVANSLLDSIFGQFVSGIASGRDLSEELVRTAVDSAPMSPDELLALGLIDGVTQLDALLEKLGGPRVLGADYERVDPASVGFDPVARFALIYGSGAVVVGRGRTTPTGGPVAATDTLVSAFEDASEDPSVRAIIFRIDSPGGSPLAADMIWRAVQVARERGKPVIVSMGNAAASGGYYVAGAADAIVASPGTLTGSIGVFAIRPVLGELFDKLDIGVETLKRGAHADMFAFSQPLSEASRRRFDEQIRDVYELFVERVASGRDMTAEQVDAIARGRVWTGEQAQRNGLVDALGGFDEAVRIAKQKAGIDEGDDVALVPFPTPETLAEQIDDVLRQAALRAMPGLPAPGTLLGARAWLSALDWNAPMLLTPFVVEIR